MLIEEKTDSRQAEQWVFAKIKQALLKNPKNNTISFSINLLSTDAKQPSSKEQTEVIWKYRITVNGDNKESLWTISSFSNRGAITLTPEIGIEKYELTVDKEKFNKIYKQYKKQEKGKKIKPKTGGLHSTESNSQSHNVELYKQALERRFTFLITGEKNDITFFRGIADYSKFIIESLYLKTIIEKIENEEKYDYNNLITLEIKAQEEITDAVLNLKNYIKTKKVVLTDPLRDAIDDYNGYVAGRITSSRHGVVSKYDAVCEILRTLNSEGYNEAVKKFANINFSTQSLPMGGHPGQYAYIKEYTFSPHFIKFQQELEHLKERRETSIWGSWKAIYLVYLVIHKKQEAWEEIGNNTLLLLDFSIIVGEMKNIEEGKNPSEIHNTSEFKKDKYFLHINRIHNYLIEYIDGIALPLNQTSSSDSNNITDIKDILPIGVEEERPQYVIERNIGYLKFGKFGKKIKIGESTSRPFLLLQCLMTPYFGVRKTIEEVFESIRLPKDSKDSDLLSHDNHIKKRKMISLIRNSAIKELQKDNKLRGKIVFDFSSSLSTIALKYLP